MTQPWDVWVIVPARNEAQRVTATLTSIAAAARRARSERARTRVRCVVALDRCDDDTSGVIDAFVRVEPDLAVLTRVVRHGCVGASRAEGTRLALSVTDRRWNAVWLANTDADTVVPERWLVAQLDLADRGVVGVAGTVGLGDDAALSLRRRFSETYRIGFESDTRTGAHRHVHGANLAFRADAYSAAGGWAPMTTGEDHHLWRRVRAIGPCVSTTALAVTTSARTIARTPAGFASDVCALIDGIVA
jgi:cellulose synthase/poly-beta-1,6-N-acetylglucosamine synthase-like glycosyltransferase